MIEGPFEGDRFGEKWARMEPYLWLLAFALAALCSGFVAFDLIASGQYGRLAMGTGIGLGITLLAALWSRRLAASMCFMYLIFVAQHAM